eukprot:5867944-Pleurochrysis_carterae.AAC.1
MPGVVLQTLAHQIRALAHHHRTRRQSISCLEFGSLTQACSPRRRSPPDEDGRRIAAELLQLRARAGWLPAARSASAASYPSIGVITLTVRALTEP